MKTPDTILDHRMRFKRVMIHIDRNLGRRLPLSLLADVACYSPFHFIRVFENLMGETPRQYVRRKRSNWSLV